MSWQIKKKERHGRGRKSAYGKVKLLNRNKPKSRDIDNVPILKMLKAAPITPPHLKL